MKKVICMVVAITLLTLFSLPAAALEDMDTDYYTRFKGQNMSINVYNWGQYISDQEGDLDINKEFEDLTGIKVNYTTFASNEEMYAKLRSGGASYDVVIPSDYMITRMISEKMLTKPDFSNIPNYQYISEEFKGDDYNGAAYSVPYTWGTVVIIYNKKLVDPADDVETWGILWNKKYKGNILMFNNPRDAFGIALKMSGYTLNPENKKQIEDAAKLLKEQKSLVQAYVMDEIFDKMSAGEAAIAPYYAGDAITMMADNPNLAAAYPREGTNRFVDAMCIPTGAKNKEAAEMYINFMCEPEVAAANADYIGYSTPNSAALELLDEDVRNSISYPSKEILAKSEAFVMLPNDLSLAMDEAWKGLLTDDKGFEFLLMPAIVGIAVLAIAFIIIRRINKQKKESRY